MAVDMFLKLGDIKGESQDIKHKGEIDVVSWSWGATQTGSRHLGSGGGAGKVAVQDIHIVKRVESSSPNVLIACCAGSHIKEATITVRKAGEKPLEFLKMKLEDVLVSSVAWAGHGADEQLTENLSLNFAKIMFDYTPQKADGTGDATITAGWNVAHNVKD
jgi:type VI secretion system secreted protein Hcp